MQDEATEDSTPSEIRKKRFTGTIFIVLKSQSDMHKVVHKQMSFIAHAIR